MRPNYEFRVGLFTFFALILLLYGWSWLKSASLFHKPQRFIVQFHDVAGLPKNATVNINGVRVGAAEGIDLVDKGNVHVHLKITADNVVVTDGSTITIQTLGLVGAKYIEITLPEVEPGGKEPPPIAEGTVVEGEDPVRIELVLNEVASKVQRTFSSVKSDKAGTSLAEALEHSGEAVKNINEASQKLNKEMDHISEVTNHFDKTSVQIGKAAEKAQSMVSSADTFFVKGSGTLENVDILAQDLQGTAGRVNKLLDNPALSKDLKETAQLAKQTADTIALVINQLDTTLNKKEVRDDVLTMLTKLNDTTDDIYKSIQGIGKMTGDEALRDDIRQIVLNAKEAMNKVDKLLNEPDTDLSGTITEMRQAASNVDLAARQLHQILDKPQPLVRMMFGRPGHIKQKDLEKMDRPKVSEKNTGSNESK